MHTFQPLPIDMVEFNPFTKLSKEWALVSTGNKIKANAMTVSWGGLGELWGKDVVFLFIRDSRYTKVLLDQGDLFTVAFMGEEYREALNFCGKNSGRDIEDKYKEAGLTAAFRHGIPYPDEANFVIVCEKMAAVPITEDTFLDPSIKEKWYPDGDFHTMYIGHIVEIMAR